MEKALKAVFLLITLVMSTASIFYTYTSTGNLGTYFMVGALFSFQIYTYYIITHQNRYLAAKINIIGQETLGKISKEELDYAEQVENAFKKSEKKSEPENTEKKEGEEEK